MDEVKDYYRILEVEPFATPAEIKTAYRRLAHQLHPDKTNNDPYTTARFALIKEAYEVLIDPARKEYYLQQRWYEHSRGRKTGTFVVTPANVLKKMLELDRYVAGLDIHRLDTEGLYAYLSDLLSPATIDQLNGFREPAVGSAITASALQAAHALPYPLANSLADRLELLQTLPETTELLASYRLAARRMQNWNRYRLWIILLITILLVLSLFFISR